MSTGMGFPPYKHQGGQPLAQNEAQPIDPRVQVPSYWCCLRRPSGPCWRLRVLLSSRLSSSW